MTTVLATLSLLLKHLSVATMVTVTDLTGAGGVFPGRFFIRSSVPHGSVGYHSFISASLLDNCFVCGKDGQKSYVGLLKQSGIRFGGDIPLPGSFSHIRVFAPCVFSNEVLLQALPPRHRLLYTCSRNLLPRVPQFILSLGAPQVLPHELKIVFTITPLRANVFRQ